MEISFKNKVALVTGAGGGLGLATAKAFAEAGAAVAMADWDEKLITSAAKELTAQGHKILAIPCDVSDEAQVEAMVEKTVATLGRLDAAYNNAAVQNEPAEAADQKLEDFERVIGINLRGVWSCMKYELRQMSKQGSDAIVNCSSMGAVKAGAKQGTYQASKHGVLGLTACAAVEYAARGIRVNSICPGLFLTPMAEKMNKSGQGAALEAMVQRVPIKRYGRPEGIADAVLWLCSDCSSMVVGHALVIDGGITL